ncbi:MAG: hypothetical protein KatS3mg114_1309 [Planctomycetaceae bacterium]|nr:MAG: hypothetical protein KatS3mg114_1309 [Planctomycetaceae bacterium]
MLLTTFDRYLTRQYVFTLAICFISLFGLVVVIDMLENLDEFSSDQPAWNTLLLRLVRYYGLQSCFFLERAGFALMVMSSMVLLLVLQSRRELIGLVAAGIPLMRVLQPVLWCSVGLGLLMVANREVVIPALGYAAYESRRGSDFSEIRVEPVYDYSTRISIDGGRLRLSEQMIEEALFVLPVPSLAAEITLVHARQAVQQPAQGTRPAGWLLRGVEPAYSQLPLTEQGRQVVLPTEHPDELFIVTAVTCDQLYKRHASFTLLATSEILKRIHSPAFGPITVQRMITHVHQRLVDPMLGVLTVWWVLPLMVRKESRGMAWDATVSSLVVGLVFGVQQGCLMLASAQTLPADLAAWLPVFVAAAGVCWSLSYLQT